MTPIEQRIEALEQAVAAITGSLSRKQRMKLGFVSADELNANIKIAAKDAIAFAKRVYGEVPPLKITDSLDYNGQAYVFEAEVRPKNDDSAAKSIQPHVFTNSDALVDQVLLSLHGFSYDPPLRGQAINAILAVANWLDSRYPAAKRLARLIRDQANQ